MTLAIISVIWITSEAVHSNRMGTIKFETIDSTHRSSTLQCLHSGFWKERIYRSNSQHFYIPWKYPLKSILRFLPCYIIKFRQLVAHRIQDLAARGSSSTAYVQDSLTLVYWSMVLVLFQLLAAISSYISRDYGVFCKTRPERWSWIWETPSCLKNEDCI